MRLLVVFSLLLTGAASCRAVDQPPDTEACELYITGRLSNPESFELVSLETTQSWQITSDALRRYYPAEGSEWRRSGLGDNTGPFKMYRYTMNWTGRNRFDSEIKGRTQCVFVWQDGRPVDENSLVEMADYFAQRRDLIREDTVEFLPDGEQYHELPCCLPGL